MRKIENLDRSRYLARRGGLSWEMGWDRGINKGDLFCWGWKVFERWNGCMTSSGRRRRRGCRRICLGRHVKKMGRW
jgi:hypothetical protein